MMRLCKNSNKSEFSVALSTSGISTVVKMLAGLVINKIISIKLGPSGLAMIGQFLNFSTLATNLANASYGQGVTKYVADVDCDKKKVIATSNLFTIFISLIISIGIAAYANSLSVMLLNSEEYIYIFYVFSALLPLFALNSLLISIVNGFRDFKLLAVLKITNSIAGLIIAGALCWFFLLKGAFIAISINTSVVYLISIFIIIKYKKFSQLFNFNHKDFDKKMLWKLLGFTVMSLVASQLKPVVLLYIRNYILNHSGKNDAGIWEGVIRLSDYYMLVITTALSSYFLPKLSSIKEASLLRNEIVHGLKKIVPLYILVAIVIYFTRKWIILLLFSDEFFQMSNLLLPQLVGDLFMTISYMIAYLMIAKAMIIKFIIIEVIFAGLKVAFSIMFFGFWGIEGVFWANALVYCIYCLCLFFIFKNILFLKKP